MKVFMNNKVYVSQKDISFLFQLGMELPNEVYETLAILAGSNPVFEFTTINENEFISFSEPETKEFFRKIDFIINYGSYKNASYEDLDYLLTNTIYDKLDIMDSARHLINSNDLNRIKNKILKISHKINGIKDLMQIKLGVSNIQLPVRERVDKDEKYKTFLHKMMQPVFEKKDY